MPHLTIDPIIAAASVVTSLQHLVSRVTKATEGAVISVSRFNTGKSPRYHDSLIKYQNVVRGILGQAILG